MRIAITSPTFWPRVRRGMERFVHELAIFLSQRGHEVTLITGKPGRTEVRHECGYTMRCLRRRWHPVLAHAGLLEFHAFFLNCLPALLARRYDAVLCTTFLDAYAGILARRRTRTPCVLMPNGPPPRVRYVRSLTLGGAVFRRAMRAADEVIYVSRYVQHEFEARFGRIGRRLPVPVDMERFQVSIHRDHDHPVILCAAALDDERKGGALLLQAFDRLKRQRPDAILRLAGAVSAPTRQRLLSLLSTKWHRDVEFPGLGRPEELSTTYGTAAISVLPSMWEAYGMVIIESMATGTPVVGTRDGAIPELISDEGVGRLFDPGPTSSAAPANVEGLSQAMLEALELSQCPETAYRCRAHAEQYSWTRLGPDYEKMLARVIEDRDRKRVGAHA